MLIRYFWAVCAVWGVVMTVVIRLGAGPAVVAGPSLKPYADGLVRTFMILSIAAPGLMASLQHLGGFRDPFFIYSREFTNPAVLATVIIQVAGWFGLLWWVWLGQGAQTISVCSRLFRSQPLRPPI